MVILMITLNSLTALSNVQTILTTEPQLNDNVDGNWTATWSLENPDNYSVNGVEISSGKATLKQRIINFKETLTNGFNNGTWQGLAAQGTLGIGLDLIKISLTLIADTNNNRVIGVDYDKWLWQYGSNTTLGFGLGELNRPSFAYPLNTDRILITDSLNHRVIEVGHNSEFYWQYGVNGTLGSGDNYLNTPSSAVPMANGNILIADSGNNIVVEVNRSKQVVWQYDVGLKNPNYAEELSNGSILIADSNNHHVIEVNKIKQIYWQYSSGKGVGPNQLDRPNHATRLNTGNTLISDTNNHRVIEVNNTKDILWQYGINKSLGYGPNQLNKPTCAVRLPSGNTLITDSSNHRVLEVDSDNNWLWQYGANKSIGTGENHLNTPKSGLPIFKNALTGYYTSAVLDGGGITNWTTITWNQTIQANTELQIYTRTGDTPNPPTGTWSAWSQGYQNPSGDQITSPINGFIQYKVVFFTNDVNVTPVLEDLIIKGKRYEPTGELITEFFEPDGLLGWTQLMWDVQLKDQSIQPFYSISSGPPWNPVPGNGDLSNVAITTGKIRFRFLFLTSNTTITPILNNFLLRYERLGELDIINVTPNPASVVAGEQLSFGALGYDAYGREVVIDPSWSTTVGEITNGSLTAQTTVGSGFVNATQDSITGSTVVTILPGPLDHIIVIPSEITVIAGETQLFEAFGYDIFGNAVLINVTWDTDVGSMENNLLNTQKFAGKGTVTAEVDGIIGSANVTIILNASKHHPPRILSKVPDQVKPEDAEPWNLNLAKYESDEEDSGEDLRWYITDVDENLYTVTGTFSKDDILTFIVKPHAFGNNKAKLWLVDSDNMTISQTLWVNITPVNDKPIITEAPDIMVHYGEPYTFDYSNYISDIETPDDKLKLTVKEPSGHSYTSVLGLNVTYNYPQSMLGKTEEITLVASDGSATAEDIIQVSITDNHAPRLIKQFNDLIMNEGENRNNIFNLDDYFSDPDGDALSYLYNAKYIIVKIHSNHSVSITAPVSWSGTEIITFRAKDIKNAMGEGYQKVKVLGVNDPPQILPIPDLYVHYGYDYKFNLSKYIFDPDNGTDELIIWTSDQKNISFYSYDKTLMILNFPPILLGQKIWIRLFVSDGIDISTEDFLVHVTDNYPPYLKKEIIDIYFDEDTTIKNAIKLSDYFEDLDDAELDFSFDLNDNENITLVVNTNSSVDISSKENWFGASDVIFRATDSGLAFVETEVKIVVIPVNDAPIIQPIPVQYGKEGERWILDISQYISDVDNDLSDLEIIVSIEFTDLVSVTGKHFTFHSSKSIEKEIEFKVTDGNLNTTGTIKLVITSEKPETFIMGIWILLAIIILIIIGIAIYTIRKRHGKFVITDVFIIHQDGILIKYKGNTLNEDLDEDIFSGMLTGIQSLIADSFGETLRKEDSDQLLSQFKMGDYDVMIEKGEHISLVVIFKGNPGRRLSKLLKEFVTSMEKEFSTQLKKWDGQYETLDGIEKVIEPYLAVEDNSKSNSTNNLKNNLKNNLISESDNNLDGSNNNKE